MSLSEMESYIEGYSNWIDRMIEITFEEMKKSEALGELKSSQENNACNELNSVIL